MEQIYVESLMKTFRVSKRKSGLKNAVSAFFKREYEDIVALSDVSFSIKKGEIVGYIGPNGAGKSTTIKILCGILVPDSGKCTINGRNPWKERKEHVKRIGVVFGQRSQLWWDIPSEDSFELLKNIYDIDDKIYKNNKNMLVELLKLQEIVKIPVRNLSLGQRMQCEIVASLLHDPEILFLDEPTIGLDAISKVTIREFIKKVNKEKSMTVLLTTHDMSDIEALSNRIMLIGKGSLLYDGDLSSIKKKYITTKTVELKCDSRENNYKIPIIEGVDILKRSSEEVSLKVNTNKISVSQVLSIFSDILTIDDVIIGEDSLDEVVLKLYKELKL